MMATSARRPRSRDLGAVFAASLLTFTSANLRVTSVDDCPGGAGGGWHYYGGRCYIRGGRGSFSDCNFDICPRLANATLGAAASSTLACVYDGALNDFLATTVGGAAKEPGSWVGLYQDPDDRKKAAKGWTMQANGCGATYASWFERWGEPNHHFGCAESCAVMGIRKDVGADWADVSCRADTPRCLCEYPAAPASTYLATPPYSDRDCGTGKLFYAIYVLSAVVTALAAVVIAAVVCANRASPVDVTDGPGATSNVGLFPSFSRSRPEGLYQIASGFEGHETLAVNRSCRIVLQLMFSTLFLGIVFKALVVVLFLALVPPEHAAPPVVDFAFTLCFGGGACWLGLRAVRTRNKPMCTGTTYLQAFQGLVWALVASCAFTLALMLLVTAAGENVDVVGVLLNVAFGGLYATTGYYARQLQREVDLLPRPEAPDDGVELPEAAADAPPLSLGVPTTDGRGDILTDVSLDDDEPTAGVV